MVIVVLLHFYNVFDGPFHMNRVVLNMNTEMSRILYNWSQTTIPLGWHGSDDLNKMRR